MPVMVLETLVFGKELAADEPDRGGGRDVAEREAQAQGERELHGQYENEDSADDQRTADDGHGEFFAGESGRARIFCRQVHVGNSSE